MKHKFHFHGPVYKIESYGGKDFHTPIAVDVDNHIMVYDIWRWADNIIGFEWSMCRYLQNRYGQLFTPYNIYYDPKNLEIIEQKPGLEV